MSRRLVDPCAGARGVADRRADRFIGRLADRSSRIVAAAVLLVLVAGLGSACSGSRRSVRTAAKEPTREQVIRDAQRRFPDEAYLVGFGSGDKAERAEERARIDAAARIRSEITGNLRTIEVGDTTGEYSSETTSEVVERVHSEVGALIRAQHELTRQVRDGSFVAVAVVDRNELDQKYAAESAPLVERITGAWNRAIAAGEDRPEAVAAALCEADPLERQLNEKDLERRLVTRRPVWTEASLNLRKQVVALRERLKGDTEVQVIRSSATTGREIADVLLQSLGAQGYPARVVEKPSCAERDAVLLAVDVAESCGNAPIGGVRCEVRIATRGSRCNRNGSLFEVSSESGKAMHATNEALALRQAAKKIDLDQYATHLTSRVVTAMGGRCGE